MIDGALKATDVLIMMNPNPANKADFKRLDFGAVVVDCVMSGLGSLKFDPIDDLDNAELIFNATTQYVTQFLGSAGETFILEFKNQKLSSHCYGQFRFLNFVQRKQNVTKRNKTRILATYSRYILLSRH